MKNLTNFDKKLVEFLPIFLSRIAFPQMDRRLVDCLRLVTVAVSTAFRLIQRPLSIM